MLHHKFLVNQAVLNKSIKFDARAINEMIFFTTLGNLLHRFRFPLTLTFEGNFFIFSC